MTYIRVLGSGQGKRILERAEMARNFSSIQSRGRGPTTAMKSLYIEEFVSYESAGRRHRVLISLLRVFGSIRLEHVRNLSSKYVEDTWS